MDRSAVYLPILNGPFPRARRDGGFYGVYCKLATSAGTSCVNLESSYCSAQYLKPVQFRIIPRRRCSHLEIPKLCGGLRRLTDSPTLQSRLSICKQFTLTRCAPQAQAQCSSHERGSSINNMNSDSLRGGLGSGGPLKVLRWGQTKWLFGASLP